MADLGALVSSYFEAWNSHDAEKCGAFFAEVCEHRDWDAGVEGHAETTKFLAGLFEAVPNIKLTIEALHVSPSTSTVAAEITVYVGDEAKTILKVTDHITFDGEAKIKNLQAYKQ